MIITITPTILIITEHKEETSHKQEHSTVCHADS